MIELLLALLLAAPFYLAAAYVGGTMGEICGALAARRLAEKRAEQWPVQRAPLPSRRPDPYLAYAASRLKGKAK